jgi:hypothetical protein
MTGLIKSYYNGTSPYVVRHRQWPWPRHSKTLPCWNNNRKGSERERKAKQRRRVAARPTGQADTEQTVVRCKKGGDFPGRRRSTDGRTTPRPVPAFPFAHGARDGGGARAHAAAATCMHASARCTCPRPASPPRGPRRARA